MQKLPGGTKNAPGLAGRGAAAVCGEKHWRLRVKASCPLPMRVNSDAKRVCKEICPVAAQKNALETDPKLGSAVSVGGKVFAVKL